MKKKTFIIMIVALFVGVIALAIGTSYALFTFNVTKNRNFKLAVGTLELSITDTSNEDRIVINNLEPMKEETALTKDGYTFTVTNTGSIDAAYTVYLDDLIPTGETKGRIDDSLMRANLYNNTTGKSYTFSLENNRILDTGTLASGESISYTLRIWLDYNADNSAQNKYYAAKIRIDSVQSKGLALLKDVVLEQNKVKTNTPDLTTISSASDTGLYKMSVTNGFGGSNGDTYYFRGNVTNNYVSFAGYTWRIVRINEDGTIRLILDQGINNNATYVFNNMRDEYTYIYYSNSENYIKKTVNDWYQENIVTKGFQDVVATGNYFCEAAKVKNASWSTSGSATTTVYSSYTPNLECITDGNGKGYVSASAGLMTYDEIILSGGYSGITNTSYYLYETASGRTNNYNWWTMSPADFVSNSNDSSLSKPYAWKVTYNSSYPGISLVSDPCVVRPVINLKATTKVTGNGTSTQPYVVVMDENTNYKTSSNVELALSQFDPSDLKDVVMCDQTGDKYTNCGIYNTIHEAVAARDTGTIILTKNFTTNKTLTINPGKSFTIDLNGKTYEKTNSGRTIWNKGELVVNDSAGNGNIVNTASGCGHGIISDGYLVINGGTIETYGTCAAIYIGDNVSPYTGKAVINDGRLISRNGAVIRLYSTDSNPITIYNGYFESNTAISISINNDTVVGDINIYGGKFISHDNCVVYNASAATINIVQTTTPIYMSTITDIEKAVIRSNGDATGTGTINIVGNIADKCTSNPNDTTSGLCVYNDGDGATYNKTTGGVGVNNTGTATVTIDGGTYYGGHNAIRNTGTGIVTIKNSVLDTKRYPYTLTSTGKILTCSTTALYSYKDIYNNDPNGILYYTPDVIFSDGTNVPTRAQTTGIVTQVPTCEIPTE